MILWDRKPILKYSDEIFHYTAVKGRTQINQPSLSQNCLHTVPNIIDDAFDKQGHCHVGWCFVRQGGGWREN